MFIPASRLFRSVAVAFMALVLLAGQGAATAFAKEFTLPEARITVALQSDGSVIVTEEITFDFAGSFSGAFRDIPLGSGEQIVDVSVTEVGVPYRDGACAQLGCRGAAGTFGTVIVDDVQRVVWHYDATDERRTFEVSYRMVGVAVAYDDIVDVNLKVWGDEWKTGLDRLSAEFTHPGGATPGEERVWGHPDRVDGSTSLGASGTAPTLQAGDVPAGQWVEMRVTVPRSVLSSTAGAALESGPGLQKVLDEEAATSRWEAAQRWFSRTLAAVLVLGGLASVVFLISAYRRYGDEPRVEYDEEYESSPPTALDPALAAALAFQGTVPAAALSASVFELIRRGYITATAAGDGDEPDLELTMGAEPVAGIPKHLVPVADIMWRALADGPVSLADLADRMRENVGANASDYRKFREASRTALVDQYLLDETGLRTRRRGAFWSFFALVGSVILVPFTISRFGGPKNWLILGAAIMAVASISWLLMAAFRIGFVKRTQQGALENARWGAFRRYLVDLGEMQAIDPAPEEAWHRYLVYAMAFGVTPQVIDAARMRAPAPVLHYPVYSYGVARYRSGHRDPFSSVSRSLSSGVTRSSSSGGGGGFSGGGGGGSGGGGGGAW